MQITQEFNTMYKNIAVTSTSMEITQHGHNTSSKSHDVV